MSHLTIHRSKTVTPLLGKVYLPGYFYLNYTWNQPTKEKEWLTMSYELNKNKVYFNYYLGSVSKEWYWSGFFIQYIDGLWTEVGLNKTYDWVFGPGHKYTAKIPKPESGTTDYTRLQSYYSRGILK